MHFVQTDAIEPVNSTQRLTAWMSAGRVRGPRRASGEHRAGQPAEETGELLQHLRRGVQPQPAAGSPGAHGGGVPPPVLQGPEE